MFRTLKYVPNWPSGGFDDLGACRAWVGSFVNWYNTEHKHSRLNYVIPTERHNGKDTQILAQRAEILMVHKRKHPERWSGEIRNCEPVGSVYLNPEKEAT